MQKLLFFIVFIISLYKVATAQNVGIGTKAPTQKLHIYSSGTNVGVAIDGGTSGRARLGLLPGGVDNGEIGFKNSLMIGSIIDNTLVMNKELMRITSSGNVGIGTSSPTQKLHIYSSGTNVGLAIDGGTSGRARLGLLPGGVDNGEIGFKNNLMIGSVTDNTLVMNNELMRITSSGNVGIGTSSPTQKLHIYSSGTNVGLAIDGGTGGRARLGLLPGGVDNGEIGFKNNLMIGSVSDNTLVMNNELMRITSSGNVGIGTNAPAQKLHVVGNICATGTIASCSDIRYKTNILPLDYVLGSIVYLHPISYNWKEEFKDKGFTAERQIGFSAQEIEQFFPEIVQTDANGYKAVDYSRLTPVLVEAIKEQQKEINELKLRLDKLEKLLAK